MVRKLLFILLTVISISSFSQEKSVDNLVASPNEFKESTTISFTSKKDQGVILIVKNVLGKIVFKKGYFAYKGKKSIVFNGKNLNSGMYIYAIQSNNEIISKRFVIK